MEGTNRKVGNIKHTTGSISRETHFPFSYSTLRLVRGVTVKVWLSKENNRTP